MAEKSGLYDDQVLMHVAERAPGLHIHGKTQVFDLMDPKSVRGFDHTVKWPCDNNGILKGAALQLFCKFMRNLKAAKLIAFLS